MKLFTKAIDSQLFAQYPKGNDLENQKVVAKIFNPYGRGTWYIINSDPNDPDYLWAIVDLFEVEVGSVSRKDLETIKVPPFRLNLERDIYFTPVNAAELLKGLMAGKRYEEGGQIDIAEQNKDMLLNYAEELEHHTEEFEEAAKKAEKVEPWVVAKIERSTTDLSDVTHYLDSENEKRREYRNGEGEEMAKGGVTYVGDYKTDNKNYFFRRYKNSIGSFGWEYNKKYNEGYLYPLNDFDRDYYSHIKLKDGEHLFRYKTDRMVSGDAYLIKINLDKSLVYFMTDSDSDDDKNPKFDTRGIKAEYIVVEKGKYASGGEVEGVDLFEDYENIPPKVQKVLEKYSDAFEGGDYRDLEKANAALKKIGYTFEYGLDGEAYDLRKIGEKGKSESYARGGQMADGGYPSDGEIYPKDIDYDMMDYLSRTNKKVLVTLKNGDKIKCSVGKFYGDIIFHGDLPKDIQNSHYSVQKKAFEKIEIINENKYASGGMMANGGVLKVYQKDNKKYYWKFTFENGKEENSFDGFDTSADAQRDFQYRSKYFKMASGGKVKFADKVKSIKSSLLKRKKVSPSVKKDYGKTYSPKEAEESAKRIVGAMTAKERLMKKRKK